MLVLSRKPGESIKLGDNIEIILVAVEGQRVRIGIKAPREVRILRTEVEPDISKMNQQSAFQIEKEAPEILRQAAEARARKTSEKQPPAK